MDDRYEIRMSGLGGQGLILAGIILAEAAVLEGKNATHTQSHGAGVRGVNSQVDVIISDGEIDYPKVIAPDILLILSQQAYDYHLQYPIKYVTMIVDSTSVSDIEFARGLIYHLPIAQTARQIGNEIVSNIVALGTIAKLARVREKGIVSIEMLERSIQTRVPEGTEDMNLEALHRGYELVD